MTNKTRELSTAQRLLVIVLAVNQATLNNGLRVAIIGKRVS